MARAKSNCFDFFRFEQIFCPSVYGFDQVLAQITWIVWTDASIKSYNWFEVVSQLDLGKLGQHKLLFDF